MNFNSQPNDDTSRISSELLTSHQLRRCQLHVELCELMITYLKFYQKNNKFQLFQTNDNVKPFNCFIGIDAIDLLTLSHPSVTAWIKQFKLELNLSLSSSSLSSNISNNNNNNQFNNPISLNREHALHILTELIYHHYFYKISDNNDALKNQGILAKSAQLFGSSNNNSNISTYTSSIHHSNDSSSLTSNFHFSSSLWSSSHSFPSKQQCGSKVKFQGDYSKYRFTPLVMTKRRQIDYIYSKQQFEISKLFLKNNNNNNKSNKQIYLSISQNDNNRRELSINNNSSEIQLLSEIHSSDQTPTDHELISISPSPSSSSTSSKRSSIVNHLVMCASIPGPHNQNFNIYNHHRTNLQAFNLNERQAIGSSISKPNESNRSDHQINSLFTNSQCGYLSKQSILHDHKWKFNSNSNKLKLRFFHLDLLSNSLSYYRSEYELFPLSFIPISKILLIEYDANIKFGKQINFLTAKRTFTLISSSNNETNEWLAALTDAVKQYRIKIYQQETIQPIIISNKSSSTSSVNTSKLPRNSMSSLAIPSLKFARSINENSIRNTFDSKSSSPLASRRTSLSLNASNHISIPIRRRISIAMESVATEQEFDNCWHFQNHSSLTCQNSINSIEDFNQDILDHFISNNCEFTLFHCNLLLSIACQSLDEITSNSELNIPSIENASKLSNQSSSKQFYSQAFSIFNRTILQPTIIHTLLKCLRQKCNSLVVILHALNELNSSLISKTPSAKSNCQEMLNLLYDQINDRIQHSNKRYSWIGEMMMIVIHSHSIAITQSVNVSASIKDENFKHVDKITSYVLNICGLLHWFIVQNYQTTSVSYELLLNETLFHAQSVSFKYSIRQIEAMNLIIQQNNRSESSKSHHQISKSQSKSTTISSNLNDSLKSKSIDELELFASCPSLDLCKEFFKSLLQRMISRVKAKQYSIEFDDESSEKSIQILERIQFLFQTFNALKCFIFCQSYTISQFNSSTENEQDGDQTDNQEDKENQDIIYRTVKASDFLRVDIGSSNSSSRANSQKSNQMQSPSNSISKTPNFQSSPNSKSTSINKSRSSQPSSVIHSTNQSQISATCTINHDNLTVRFDEMRLSTKLHSAHFRFSFESNVELLHRAMLLLKLLKVFNVPDPNKQLSSSQTRQFKQDLINQYLIDSKKKSSKKLSSSQSFNVSIDSPTINATTHNLSVNSMTINRKSSLMRKKSESNLDSISSILNQETINNNSNQKSYYRSIVKLKNYLEFFQHSNCFIKLLSIRHEIITDNQLSQLFLIFANTKSNQKQIDKSNSKNNNTIISLNHSMSSAEICQKIFQSKLKLVEKYWNPQIRQSQIKTI